MREHIYKAKRRDNHEWIIGYYCKYGDNHCITEPTDCRIAKSVGILPETLCEYTNRKDIHGKMIFENDIVRTKYGRICRVCWVSVGGHCGFDLDPLEADHKAPTDYDLWDNLEVIDYEE